MSGRLAVGLALLALSAAAQAAMAQTAPRLTPLGPTQAPRPASPPMPVVQTPATPPAGIQAQPLPSLTGPDPAYAPRPAPPSPAPSSPSSPATQPATPPAAAPPAAAAPPPAGTPIPGEWQARGTAELIALDKVTARPATLAVKVGEQATFGTLTIAVRGCAVRPPDQPADATAFLEITDRGAAAPVFRGWMFMAEPSLAVLEHPVYDVRVAGCR
jgi:hypothetical protein